MAAYGIRGVLPPGVQGKCSVRENRVVTDIDIKVAIVSDPLLLNAQELTQMALVEEVGQEFGVTRERIRQIEAKALEKIRENERSKKLRHY